MTRFDLGTMVLLALALVGVPHVVRAAESYDNCAGFITSLPTVITTSGTWCLKQDLATSMASGAAILISTNNVTIDCNNFKLGGLAAGLGTLTVGVAAGNRLNTTIRRCNIRGFSVGVNLVGGSGGAHVVEDSRFDGNTYEAVHVEGYGSVIRRNRVFDTGGSTVSDGNAYGFFTVGSVDVLNNTISGLTARASSNGFAYGMRLDSNDSGRIIGNGVQGLVKDGSGQDIAIYNNGSVRLTVRENDLVGDASTGSVGIFCNNTNDRAKDNANSGFATAMANCGDAGGNTSIP